jgi:hypothetical protein
MIVATMMAVIGYYLFLLSPVTIEARDAPGAEVVAAALLVYQKAAVDWCLRTACPDGPVPPNAMILPPGYLTAPWLAAVAQNGRVSSYVGGIRVNVESIAASLGDFTGGGPSAGTAVLDPNGNEVVQARDFTSPARVPVPLAAGIPLNAPVVSQKVK